MSGTEQSGRARNTLADHPGPVDDQTCQHDGQLPQDPPAGFTQPCDEPAVFAVPHPSGFGQCVAFCEWHLARYVDAFDSHARRLRERFDLDAHLPDHAWLGLEDIPSQTYVDEADATWSLFALDQRGRAYYTDSIEAPSAVAVYRPGEWELYDEWYNVPDDVTVRAVADNVANAHGLAALPLDVVDHCTDGQGGETR